MVLYPFWGLEPCKTRKAIFRNMFVPEENLLMSDISPCEFEVSV